MSSPAPDPDCFMCALAGGQETGHWYDEVLAATRTAIVIPALGAIAAGHVLVVPRQHVLSAQDLAAAERLDFITCLETTAERLAEVAGLVTVFEHGAALAGSGPRSACSEHVHVQVLPGHYGLYDALEYELTFESLAAFYKAPLPFYPYLLAWESGGPVRVAHDIGQSQFFRRELVCRLGDPDGWDYWLFPREDNVRNTLTMFSQGA